MTPPTAARERVRAACPHAACLALDTFGHRDYMVVAGGRELTGWHASEERAWEAAAERVARREEGEE